MSSNFNKTLWEYGRKVEDKVLPIVNSLYDCDFKRNENDIYDILDFRDEEKKKIVEVKGRRVLSTTYKKTLITSSKITAGFMAIEEGYEVYFLFVFIDKIFRYQLEEDASFECKLTGTNCIAHYLIPMSDLTEVLEDPELEEQEHGSLCVG